MNHAFIECICPSQIVNHCPKSKTCVWNMNHKHENTCFITKVLRINEALNYVTFSSHLDFFHLIILGKTAYDFSNPNFEAIVGDGFPETKLHEEGEVYCLVAIFSAQISLFHTIISAKTTKKTVMDDFKPLRASQKNTETIPHAWIAKNHFSLASGKVIFIEKTRCYA